MHAPGPSGWPHEPQGEPAGNDGDEEEDEAPTAKTDSCFSTFSLRQVGHTGVREPRTRNSKRCPHSAQVYSNRGMTSV